MSDGIWLWRPFVPIENPAISPNSKYSRHPLFATEALKERTIPIKEQRCTRYSITNACTHIPPQEKWNAIEVCTSQHLYIVPELAPKLSTPPQRVLCPLTVSEDEYVGFAYKLARLPACAPLIFERKRNDFLSAPERKHPCGAQQQEVLHQTVTVCTWRFAASRKKASSPASVSGCLSDCISTL